MNIGECIKLANSDAIVVCRFEMAFRILTVYKIYLYDQYDNIILAIKKLLMERQKKMSIYYRLGATSKIQM